MNTWHFTCTAIDEGTRNAIQTELVDFYEALDTYKSNTMAWQNTRLRWFDLSDPEPRYPVEDELMGLTSGSTGATARELAVAVSFHGEFVSGTSAGRRRGRIYFGPLSSTVLDSSTGFISSSVVTAFATAAGALLTASNAASDWAWVVWSDAGNTAYPVVDGWVDNAPDVQRRRGARNTLRTDFI